MIRQVINSAITIIVSGVMGYCISTLKSFKKKSGATNRALKIMLQNNLTNTYFVYSVKKKIPDYVYKNWLNMLDEYEALDGDDYIHTLSVKMQSWEIIRTDILDN